VTATESGHDPDANPVTATEVAVADARPRRKLPALAVELLWLVPIAIIVALVIKAFVFQAFFIPSGSMEPTLAIGDRVLVNKLSYDFHDVHRGDIVVFDAPPGTRSDGIQDLVKRVIGLPGDTVTYSNGSVLINGHRLKEPYLQTGATTGPLNGRAVPQGCDPPPGDAAGCIVPKDRVFVLGDNRLASKDARVFGPIKESTIVGRVFIRIWPLNRLGLL
jgi:signal peptidase I